DGEALTAWFSHGEAELLGDAEDEAFLGLSPDGTPHFARLIARGSTETLGQRPELFVSDLRSIAVNRQLPSEELGPLGESKALLDWHARHRFCAQCGAPTRLGASGWRREGPAGDARDLPRADPGGLML